MKKIVYKVEPGMDRTELEATTYQMRNFYRQLGDGFFSVLDTMNYIQHQYVVYQAKKGDKILDVCCGRGLLLPMLRYNRKNIYSYTGVDIKPSNAIWTEKRVTDNKPIDKDYYPFKTRFVCSNVKDMAEKLLPENYTFVVYTSSIEHMQKDAGLQSLYEIRKVSLSGTRIILTCPNTPENKDGYDTQYAAHIYEWKRSELIKAFDEVGFRILDEWSILSDKKEIMEALKRKGLYQELYTCFKHIPSEWIIPVLSPLAEPKEIAFMLGVE